MTWIWIPSWDQADKYSDKVPSRPENTFNLYSANKIYLRFKLVTYFLTSYDPDSNSAKGKLR